MDIEFFVGEDEQLPLDAWRYLVKRRAGFRCEDCSSDTARFDAHHKDRNRSNNTLSNGECLCRPCHGKKTPNPKTPEHVAKMIATRRANGAWFSDEGRERVIAGAVKRRGRGIQMRCPTGCTCGKHRRNL